MGQYSTVDAGRIETEREERVVARARIVVRIEEEQEEDGDEQEVADEDPGYQRNRRPTVGEGWVRVPHIQHVETRSADVDR